MNDFSDDSAVKFYLNKWGTDSRDSALTEEDKGDDTLYAETSRDTVKASLVIFPEDLPVAIVFDPLTKAIVFKNTLRDRTTSTSSISSGVSQSQRRKVFTFPKNVTVAEVIERGLERFGILEGVVDGGDEVEDKLTRRRSSTKYLTSCPRNASSPSSRIVDAYTQPPTFRRVQEGKRSSIDFTPPLGNMEDVGPDGPILYPSPRNLIPHFVTPTPHVRPLGRNRFSTSRQLRLRIESQLGPTNFAFGWPCSQAASAIQRRDRRCPTGSFEGEITRHSLRAD
ncbi:hypothetical protein HYDPIDRAFT_33224 [Hydnomerulius pinastri MD-312]|uniref:Unplaced genomic scaffold scaffold_54, whole genome shotgun sequence n=1 Tax=Hydnomerulius pinastri MD-312 TaxID=994086 RepID=A0A0C9W0P4_9AGAM|nr:hypothetical protein HYDPIDRAFT_33224 [Hydnomerulius pinastri MD-312]